MANIVKQLAPNIVVDDHGNIWQYTNDGMGGLGGFDWKQVGQYFLPITGAVAAWIGTRGQPKEIPNQGQPVGAQVQANAGGIFGSIDSTTLILILAGFGLFLAMPPSSGRR